MAKNSKDFTAMALELLKYATESNRPSVRDEQVTPATIGTPENEQAIPDEVEDPADAGKMYYRELNYGKFVHVFCGTKTQINESVRQHELIRANMVENNQRRPVPEMARGNSRMYRAFGKCKLVPMPSSQTANLDEAPRGCVVHGPLRKPRVPLPAEPSAVRTSLKCRLVSASRKRQV